MAHSLTLQEALEALLVECELTLDRRHSYRRAMSNAHTALLQAKEAHVPALHGTITLGGPEDEDLTFGELFGEPDRSSFSPVVVSIARGIAATDGAVAREVAHG
jgi:hypothetical protein